VTHSLEADYRALTEAAGFADISDRSCFELTGDDRAKFLHNLCSNDILRLTPGQGCEAFLLNAKGKVVGHIFVYCSGNSLILDSSPGQGEKIVAHLDRYIIREKVELRDLRQRMTQLLVAGPQTAEILGGLGCPAPQERLGHGQGAIAGMPVFLRRSGLAGDGSFTLVGLAEHKDSLVQALLDAGARECGPAACAAARIEAGVPLYGADITDDNLPQEVDRNQHAISFTKGCYLGQETVARIDALGHVNRKLVGLNFSSPEATRCELKAGDVVVGSVTSAAFSPRLGAAIGLGYVRQGHNQPGARLACWQGEAEVVALPMR
jgi:folate-binding protein YgfZ